MIEKIEFNMDRLSNNTHEDDKAMLRKYDHLLYRLFIESAAQDNWFLLGPLSRIVRATPWDQNDYKPECAEAMKIVETLHTQADYNQQRHNTYFKLSVQDRYLIQQMLTWAMRKIRGYYQRTLHEALSHPETQYYEAGSNIPTGYWESRLEHFLLVERYINDLQQLRQDADIAKVDEFGVTYEYAEFEEDSADILGKIKKLSRLLHPDESGLAEESD